MGRLRNFPGVRISIKAYTSEHPVIYHKLKYKCVCKFSYGVQIFKVLIWMYGIAWKCDKPTNHQTDLGVHKEVILPTIVLDNYRKESQHHSGCNILWLISFIFCRSIEQKILNTLYFFGLNQTGSLFQLRNPMENFTYATVKGSSVDMYFRRQVHTGC